jgi:uncharacterized protein YyaL (SSP411 family)
MSWGLLELYQAGFEPWALEAAFALADRLLERHADPLGGFFQSAEGGPPGGLRLQSSGDGALPAANSVALGVLLRLSRIGERPAYLRAAEDLLHRHAEALRRHPQGFAFLLAGLDFHLGPSSEVVLAGAGDGEDTAALARALRRSYLPRTVSLLRPSERPGGLEEPAILRLAPFTRACGPSAGGRAQAYVCRNRACLLPTSDPQAMLALLRGT